MEVFPGIRRVGPPWALMGSGYILVFKPEPPFADMHSFIPSSLKHRFRGGIGTVMFVDYQYSDAGPYREILFIPGRFRFGRGDFFSITKIYVSTMESVVSGQENWGIPKELAAFEVMKEDESTERIRVSNEGKAIVELVLRSYPGKVPVTTSLCPPSLRTLAHEHGGRTLLTTLKARGWAGPARLVSAAADPVLFPDFSRNRPVLAVRIPEFFMVFPKAEIL